jgi:hypothetical protein
MAFPLRLSGGSLELDDSTLAAQMKAMTVPDTPDSSNDPAPATTGITPYARARYRRLMKWMVAVSFATAATGLLIMKIVLGTVPIHMAIAVTLGVFFSVLLAATLMGLVFLSSGSGHDDTVRDHFDENHP